MIFLCVCVWVGGGGWGVVIYCCFFSSSSEQRRREGGREGEREGRDQRSKWPRGEEEPSGQAPPSEEINRPTEKRK